MARKPKLFADYFYEELSYAIYTPNSRSFDTLAPYLAESDGQAFSLGLRYDF